MRSCNSGGKRGGESSRLNALINQVTNPTTKGDFMLRLEVIAEVGQPTYKTVAKITDWDNYGKSRTYFKVDAYRDSDGRLHHTNEYGYYDNKAKKYVATNKYNDMEDSKIFTMSGSSMPDDKLRNALKNIIKKKG